MLNAVSEVDCISVKRTRTDCMKENCERLIMLENPIPPLTDCRVDPVLLAGAHSGSGHHNVLYECKRMRYWYH